MDKDLVRRSGNGSTPTRRRLFPTSGDWSPSAAWRSLTATSALRAGLPGRDGGILQNRRGARLPLHQLYDRVIRVDTGEGTASRISASGTIWTWCRHGRLEI